MMNCSHDKLFAEIDCHENRDVLIMFCKDKARVFNRAIMPDTGRASENMCCQLNSHYNNGCGSTSGCGTMLI